MPLFDLRIDEKTLHRMAPFKVLAVMCHPNDNKARERMLGHIQSTSGVQLPRRRPLSIDEFRSEVRISALNAGVAGGILLTRLQLCCLHYQRYTINSAIPLVRAELREGELPGYATRSQYGAGWPKDATTRKSPVSGRKMLEHFPI
jgi:hypothetical protein